MRPQEGSTWLEIDTAAIQNNIHQIQTITQRPVMAVVKANGYGHGMVEAARAAAAAGAAWCAVARIDEALALRQAGIRLPILVMGFCPPERAAEAAHQHIRLSVYDLTLARQMAEQVAPTGSRLRLHVKVDTGMGRLGVMPAGALDLVSWLAGQEALEVEGIFTHFARADEPAQPETDAQIDTFIEVLHSLSSTGLRPPLVHAANSAASLYFPRAYFDMVRPGIAIYGLHPSPDAPLPPSFRPALSWKARLASVKMLPAGQGIGYGHRYVTAGEERIGVLPVGYADGLRRQVGVNAVLVNGRKVPVVGGVCMDQCMLQLDEVPAAQPGDEVVLIGSQGEAARTAEEIAQSWGTVNYDVVCGLAARVPRFYD